VNAAYIGIFNVGQHRMWSTASAASTPPAGSRTGPPSPRWIGDGDRLTLTADAGVMIARRDPGGMVTVLTRPCMVIPAALRLGDDCRRG
jgi:hypothetical protein